MPTKIPWTTEAWNPFHGCTKVSSGCANCYAKTMATRLAAMGVKGYSKKDPFAVRLMPGKLNEPWHWRKPRLVFVGSMGDLFHRSIPTEYISRVFKVMAECPQHIFQVLTKRPGRMAKFMETRDWPGNIWLGISVEDARSHTRLRFLRPDATRSTVSRLRGWQQFGSYEPALGPIDWGWWSEGFDWLIIGCESGSGRRPFRNEWAASAIAECHRRGVPVFVKQIIVDGKVSHDPSKWPRDLRVQEYPEAMRELLEAAG